MALLCNVTWAQTSADGPIVTFTNVQQDGTTFTLYINENDELAISSSSAADLSDAAKFRAIQKDNGKWAFYNESKKLYMIWRGKNAGYNSDKGVLAEYNATYCDWSVNQSTNLELGYLFVSKRNGGTSDGSLVIMKETRAFDAYGNTEGWDSNYSNLYRIDIVELAPRTTDFVYNVTDGAYAGSGWCKSWASNDAAKPNLTISVDVNNVNGGQANGIGLRPGKAGSATYTMTAGCTMLSLSFEAKGTDNHKILINGVEKAVGTQWKRFVIHNINAATAEFILKGDNDNDCLLRNVRFVTPALPLRAEVEDSWADNPNTHFGRVTATAGNNVTTMNLTTDHEETTHMLYGGGVHEVGFTRAYRGFEFQGFFLGEKNLGKSFTLTEEQEANITEQNPLVAKFVATETVTLFYDDDEFSYRIPAIATTSTGRIFAVSDYRHNLDDIGRDKHGTGTMRIDLVARYSDNNGETWSETMTIAAGDNTKTGSYLRAFGDAAIAAVGENIVVMAAAGDQLYPYATVASPNKMARIFSSDNGQTWSITEMTTKMYTATGLIPDGVAAFFGSGKMVVDANFNDSGKARIYGALLVRRFVNDNYSNYNNYVVYSDDLGETWNILGGSQTPVASGDEPKAEILPNGQILLSARRGGGRVFNVFTYTDKANNAGTWDTAANGCGNGGSNATNGEIFCVDAKKPDGTAVKLLMQSQPKGGSGQYDRKDVTIWYKEIDANTTYATATIKDNWIEGLQVSHQQSSYSAVTIQPDGRIALFFEEAPCYGDNYEKGYCMVYVPLTIENITKGHYFSSNADLTVERTISVELTDAQGNVYSDQLQCGLTGVAAALATKYPFITLGDNANLETDGENFTYTNTVTLPFKVSNEKTTVWHNIYWHGNNENELVYLYGGASGDEYVAKKAPGSGIPYGASDYNTAKYADNMSWAIYHAGNFTFTFKNKLTNKFIQVTGVATNSENNGKVQNAKFVEEGATAFEIVTKAASQTYKGDYSLKATVNDVDGYLCNTSASYGWATHYNGNGHQGGWATFQEAPDFTALIAEVNATLGMIGTSLGQYKVTDANAATAETAKEAMQNSATVKLNDLNTYKGLLDGATLNMPKNGQYFRVAYDYGDNVGKLYMQGENSNVKGVKFTADKGDASIWQYRDGGLYSYTAEKYLNEAGDDRGLKDSKMTATFSASPRTKGKYNIACTSYIHANKNDNGQYYSDHCSSNNCAAHDLILEEIEPTTVTIGNVGYSTLYSTIALSIPEGVKAYTGELTETDEEKILTLNKVDGIIPANTGVVLYGEANGYNFNIAAKVPAIENNALRGTATDIKTSSVTDGYVYTLQRHGFNTEDEAEYDGVAFKKYIGETITAGKAFLVLPSAQQAQALRIRFAGDDSTGIEHSEFTIQNSEFIYDLQGRRVANPTKGFYIVNGKKVVIK